MKEIEKEMVKELLIKLFLAPPRLSKEEMEKLINASKKRDEKGRVVLELKGDIVIETKYNDASDGTYSESQQHHNVSNKSIQKKRPDLVAWANTVREQIKEIKDKSG